MTRFSVSVFENEIGTGHRFLINRPQRPLRFINLICQNTVAQHHPESVSSAKNKRRQILLRKTKQPGITLNQRNHLRYRNIFIFFRFFPVIHNPPMHFCSLSKTGVSIVSTDTSSAKSIFIDVISQNFKR